MSNIKILQLDAEPKSNFTSLEGKARKLIGQGTKNLTLLAWWDRAKKTGGPREACSDETVACVATYAAAHGSQYQVRVNGGEYDLFYGAPSGDYAELDRRMVEEVHRHAKRVDFDNVQGG
jgi:hypothetical protein